MDCIREAASAEVAGYSKNSGACRPVFSLATMQIACPLWNLHYASAEELGYDWGELLEQPFDYDQTWHWST